MVALGEVTSSANAIPRSSYLFGASWPHVRRTLLVAVEQDGDPYAVMVPTAEIIRFYYAPSTRLAQALFWGEYNDMFNAERSGIFEEGVVRVHLRRWLEDQDAWTLARYICSPVMQREATRLYRSLQVYQINSHQFDLGAGSGPSVRVSVRGSDNGSRHISVVTRTDAGQVLPRWLILRIERCSAPFPFDQVIVDRDNNSAPGENVEDENLIPCVGEGRKIRSRGGEAGARHVSVERGTAARPGAVEDRSDRGPLRST